ncbi:MAG: hypothetical protein ACYTGQ_04605 [Planctomycetota bacterium]|jgi:hypothetical protein
MSHAMSRRHVLRSAALGTTVAGLDLGFLSALHPICAAETALPDDAVRLDPSIEPLVRLIETTPRKRLLEEVAGRIARGLSYREVLAGLLLAGVRNVQPRPHVGFKFHCVLVVNSAHQASLASPDEHRWLPIFWALDYFKAAQATDENEGDWTMAPVDESAVPAPRRARAAFVEAMDGWDVEAADAATAGLARTASLNECFELFARYAARDYRSIGHKAIFVASAFRALHAIGWRHAEPVLRSLTYALLNHNNEPNPATADLRPDRAFRANRKRIDQIQPSWRAGRIDSGATLDMLAALRDADTDTVSKLAVEQLNTGVSARSLWDAYLLGGAELLVADTGIVSLHSLTCANALHYAYQTAADDATRLTLLLQAPAFLTHFRQDMGPNRIRDTRIERLAPTPTAADPGADPHGALGEIFADVGKNRSAGAAKALAYLGGPDRAKALIDAARVLVFLKGTGSHDYKFSSAVLEDYHHLTPVWRDRYLAASTYYLQGTSKNDNRLVRRTRDALHGA